jgi:hypothetical protein
MSLTLDHTLVPTTIIIRESIRHRFAAQLDLEWSSQGMLLESPITIGVDAELPTATFNRLLSLVPGSIMPPNDAGPVIEEDRSD